MPNIGTLFLILFDLLEACPRIVALEQEAIVYNHLATYKVFL